MVPAFDEEALKVIPVPAPLESIINRDGYGVTATSV